jgi:hypothetical protein
VLDPAAFDLSALPPVSSPSMPIGAMGPALMVASFTMLKTSHVMGQLYVAILIALILGRFRRGALCADAIAFTAMSLGSACW